MELIEDLHLYHAVIEQSDMGTKDEVSERQALLVISFLSEEDIP